MSDDEMCACGRPLHYANPQTRAAVEAVVKHVSPCVEVETPYGRWLVPRHYIALHGLSSETLPLLAKKYRFVRVIGKEK